jgi:hypothetical protein
MANDVVMPRHEPEVMRANGRRYASECNRICRKPYGKAVYQALGLAKAAYKVHGLPYVAGLREIENYPPDRFTWFYDGTKGAKEGVRVRDTHTGLIAVWPHWPE